MPLSRHPGLNALYYPYSMCRNEIALKRLILIFDSIGFIHPYSSGFGFSNYGFGQYARDISRTEVFTEDLPETNIEETENFDHWMDIFTYLERCHLDCCVAMSSSWVGSQKLVRFLNRSKQNGSCQRKKTVVCQRDTRWVETDQGREAQKSTCS